MNKNIKLTPRLQHIANQVSNGATVADIGTDHAYIPIYLIQNGIAASAIASDVRIGPVHRAKNNVQKYNLQNKIDVRLGNGLEKIKKGECDTIIIAGMGGVLMCEILSGALSVVRVANRLILQPMIGQEEVRKWLQVHEFQIVDEELVAEENKIYNIIVAEKGKDFIDKDIYYDIGKKLIEKKDPLLKTLLIARIDEMKKIIGQLHNQTSENAHMRLRECQMRLEEYEELLINL